MAAVRRTARERDSDSDDSSDATYVPVVRRNAPRASRKRTQARVDDISSDTSCASPDSDASYMILPRLSSREQRRGRRGALSPARVERTPSHRRRQGRGDGRRRQPKTKVAHFDELRNPETYVRVLQTHKSLHGSSWPPHLVLPESTGPRSIAAVARELNSGLRQYIIPLQVPVNGAPFPSHAYDGDERSTGIDGYLVPSGEGVEGDTFDFDSLAQRFAEAAASIHLPLAMNSNSPDIAPSPNLTLSPADLSEQSCVGNGEANTIYACVLCAADALANDNNGAGQRQILYATCKYAEKHVQVHVAEEIGPYISCPYCDKQFAVIAKKSVQSQQHTCGWRCRDAAPCRKYFDDVSTAMSGNHACKHDRPY